MEEKSEEKEFKSLFSKYIFHIIIFIFIFITHIIIYLKIYWDNNIIKLLFFSFSMIQIIYIIIPIISFILIKINHFNSKVEIFKILGKIFLGISIILGIFFSILIIINTVYGKKFRNDCPFNASNDFYSGFYEDFSEDENINELKDKCQERRCILIEHNEDFKYPYKYLCNYNPQDYFNDKLGEPYSRSLSNGTELKTYNMIECSLIGPIYSNNFNNKTILDYLNICYFLGDFYNCQRFEEPKKYNIENIKECPDKNYTFIQGILCVYIIVFDIFISFIPWLIEDKSYNSLLIIIDEEFSDINNNNIEIKNSNKNINSINRNINSSSNRNHENEKKIKNSTCNIKTSNNSININNNNENQINSSNQLKNKNSLYNTKWETIISNNPLNYKKEDTKFLYSGSKSNNDNNNNKNAEINNNNIENNNKNAINSITNNINDNNNENNEKKENVTENNDKSNNVKTYSIKKEEKLKNKEEEDKEEEKDEDKSIDISNRNIDKNKSYENGYKNNNNDQEETENKNDNSLNIKKFYLKSSSISII